MKSDSAAATTREGIVEKRRHPRTRRFGPQQLTVQAITGSPPEPIRCTLWDFNEGGLGMDAPQALNIGDRVKIRGDLIADDYSMAMDAQARIVYCRRIETGRYRVGVAFIEVQYRRLDQSHE